MYGANLRSSSFKYTCLFEVLNLSGIRSSDHLPNSNPNMLEHTYPFVKRPFHVSSRTNGFNSLIKMQYHHLSIHTFSDEPSLVATEFALSE